MPTTEVSSHFPTLRLTLAARMADYQQRMASQIRREREKRGWRREDLAQKTGASYRQIERWETGKSRPHMPNRLALAEVFEMELTELFPDIEAEEEALREQLNRIEAELARHGELLEELVSRLPAEGLAAAIEAEADRLDAQRERSGAEQQRKARRRKAS